ncbi:MAG: SpoIIIAH-like family protein [Clostridia bacterium]
MQNSGVGRGARLSMCLGALAAVVVCFTIAYPVAFSGRQQAQPSAPKRAVPATADAAMDPLAQFRTDRAQLRARETAQLRGVADDRAAGDAVRDKAREMLLELAQYSEQELTLEGVLRARGFPNPLATVHEDSVNILIQADAITRAQSATILELAMRETGESGGNIKIIPVGE